MLIWDRLDVYQRFVVEIVRPRHSAIEPYGSTGCRFHDVRLELKRKNVVDEGLILQPISHRQVGEDLDCHPRSVSPESTDWRQITLLYDRLMRIQPSPVVELNRAVAVAMHEGPAQGRCLIDDLLAHEELANYSLAHSARADLCRRLGQG
jgi:predicted RNA polymerase sigma factor